MGVGVVGCDYRSKTGQRRGRVGWQTAVHITIMTPSWHTAMVVIVVVVVVVVDNYRIKRSSGVGTVGVDVVESGEEGGG